MQEKIYFGLKCIPIFSEVEEDALRTLASLTIVRTKPRNSIIFNEGDESGNLHIILSGKVRVYLSNEEGKEVTLNQQDAGTYFGELALFDDSPRSATVITLDNSTFGIISKEAFKTWLNQHPDAALKIIKEMVKKIRDLTENVKGFALCGVYGRLIKTLKGMAVEKDGQLVIDNRPTQQNLANMIGCSREMVAKIYKELIKGDYISVDGKVLTIKRKLPDAW
ncbi:MAG: Crp/Fnr family transcriptional regulator [Methylococcales bacterium]